MVLCSAPGKVYLFGEHAVVYGKAAIACAVDLRTRVRAEVASSFRIESEIAVTGLDFEKHPYVSAVIERLQEFVSIEGVSIKVDSDLPVGSGLGSSAAVTIASLGALNELFGCKLELETLAKLGHEIELRVQGAASPTDTYVSTFGGVVTLPDRRKLPSPECGIVIGDTGFFSSTKELVTNVRLLKERYPELIEPLLSSIGNISGLGEAFVREKDYASVGKLMDVNQGLLDALGVSSLELSKLIYAARDSKAFGAKLTGAGRGGCMFALTAPKNSRAVAEALQKAGGKSIITKATGQGLKVET